MSTMRAAVLHGNKDLRLENVQRPTLNENEVLIKIAYNGLCGTDASEYAKGPFMVPLSAPHPGSGHQGPTVLGHEFIGTVIEAGASAQEMLGKRVACGAGVSCGECKMCTSGRTNLCASYYTLGLSWNGGLAEFAAAPKDICVPIPDDCIDEYAALTQPLAVGIHAVKRAGVVKGDRVVLLGVGAIGSFVCVALQKLGVDITAVDVDQKRLDIALKLGAKKAVLISKEITPQELLTTIGHQSEVVFETSGAPGAGARALAITNQGGTLMLLGLNKIPQEFPFFDAVLREVTLQTTVAHVCKDDMPEAIQLLKSGVVAKLLTDRVVHLENAVEAFEDLVAGRASGKILVSPTHG